MKQHLFFLVFIFVFNNLPAQENLNQKYTNQPLEMVLNRLQKQFEARFSYPSKLIENEKVTIAIDTTSLVLNLNRIESQTSIIFHEIDTNNFILKTSETQEQLSVCGSIFDAKNKLPITGVTITNLNRTKNYTSQTNGYFELFNLEKTTRIKFQRLGYKTLVIDVSEFDKDCKKIFLKNKNITLSEVTIQNYLTTGFTKNKDGSINVKPRKTQILPGLIEPDVLQSAQLIPGIQSPDETATGLNIRGGTPDYNLIIYDDIKIYHYDHFFGMLSAFNTNIINDVKIYKNASPSKYRSHISGDIDIKTDHEIPKKIKGGVGINMIYANAFLKIPVTKKIGIEMSARRSFSHILETITFDSYSDYVFQNTKITDENAVFNTEQSKKNNTYYFEDYTLSGIFKPSPKSELKFSSIYSNNNLNFKSQFNEISQSTIDLLTIENLGLNINYTRNWNKRFSSTLSASYSSYDFSYKGEELLNAFFNYETVKENKINDTNISLDVEYQFNNYHSVMSGYDLIINDISYTIGRLSDVIFDDDYTLESLNSVNGTHSFFNEYRFKNNHFSINTGLRSTYFSSLKTFYFQPNLNANLRINNNLSVQLSLDKKNQFVSQIVEFETQNFGLENQVWALSNSNKIPVLENKQVSFSALFKKNDWYIDVATYIKQSKGITSLTKGFNRNIADFSTGKSETKGFELLVKKELNNFSTLVSYALTDTAFQFKDLNNGTNFKGNFDIRHYLTIIQTAKFNNLELSAGWRFKTPRPYTPVNGLIGDNADNIQINYGKINSARLDSYSRFDVSSTYKFKVSKTLEGIIGVSLLNVFDKSNNISRYHRIILDIDNAAFTLRELNKFSIGRTLNMNFQLKF